MAKLGSEKRSAIVHIKTQARGEEILDLCNKHGWQVIISIEPEKSKDISDVKRLLTPSAPMTFIEVPAHRERLKEILGINETPQFAFRLGYAQPVKYRVRRSAEEVLVVEV